MLRRLTLVICAAVLVGGCGNEEHPGVDEPAREGLAVEMGGVDYNVFITRQLNPGVQPDEAYYTEAPAAPGKVLYGVFLEACNVSDEPQQTASEFTITNNQDEHFEPLELPEDNQFVYSPTRLDPKECTPEAGSVAQLGPTEGMMIGFEFPLQATENRPLELEVENPSDEGPEHITYELDF